jgi:hypothetical protein
MAKKSVKSHELSASRMPGFHADASLYVSRETYRSSGGAGGDYAAVQAAIIFPRWCGPCNANGLQTCCVNFGLSRYCYTQSCWDPCARCRTPEECCICNGGVWDGRFCE